MSASQLITQSPFRPALPVPLIYKPRRLLTQQASVTVQFGSSDLKAELLAHRATRTTSFFTDTDIEGYRHGGLNE